MSQTKAMFPESPGRGWRAYANCPSCGKFKSRPSAVCRWCGDDPVPFNWDRHLYDRERDWPYW